MKPDALIKLYPWAKNPFIAPFAEQFSEEEWNVFNQTEIPELLEQEKLEDIYIIALFESISIALKIPELKNALNSGQLSFRELVDRQIKTTLIAMSQPGPTKIFAIVEWLGEDLIKRNIRSDTEMDNLVQLLSSKKIQKQLSGDAAALATLHPVPTLLAQFKGQDLRSLLRNNTITFQQFIAVATQLNNLPTRKFPHWVGENLELQAMANQFTDMQLTHLERLMKPGVLKDTELKCGLLRTILITTTLNGQPKIASCVDVAQFEKLTLTIQRSFLHTFNTQGSTAAGHLAKGFFTPKKVIPTEVDETINDHLLRLYLRKYSDPRIPLPTDDAVKQQEFEVALRNAANLGKFWDLLLLIHEVTNINAKSLTTGKTALHYAAMYAAANNDRLCFDLLANQSQIDFTIKDKEGKTALDYWDFVKLPDDALKQKMPTAPAAAANESETEEDSETCLMM